MNYCAKTDVGKKREINEDFFAFSKLADNAHIFVICDGMGGEAGGEIASKLAAESFVQEVTYQCSSRMIGGELFFAAPETEIPMMLDSALANANFEVWQKAQDDKTLHGMGTTLVAALVLLNPLRLFTVNIGDSRIYKINSDTAQRLTKDHSYVQYLIDKGEITPKQAESRTDKNIITRAVGISIRAEGDIAEAKIEKSDRILLCTDGLCGMMTDDEIQGIVSFLDAKLEKKAERLISLANDAGGDDNITLIIVEFTDGD